MGLFLTRMSNTAIRFDGAKTTGSNVGITVVGHHVPVG